MFIVENHAHMSPAFRRFPAFISLLIEHFWLELFKIAPEKDIIEQHLQCDCLAIWADLHCIGQVIKVRILAQPVISFTVIPALIHELVYPLAFQIGAHISDLLQEEILVEPLCATHQNDFMAIIVGRLIDSLLE